MTAIRAKYVARRVEIDEIEPKHKGARAELAACVWLLENGYEVFRNVSFHGIIDVVAIRGSETLLLDVKSTPLRASKEQLDAGVQWIMPMVGGGFSIFTPELKLADIPCEVCGRPMTGRRARRWCSQTCRNKTDREVYAASRRGAGAQETGVGAPQAPETGNASAGSGEPVMAWSRRATLHNLAMGEAVAALDIKKPRAPKRDIRGMVLGYVQTMTVLNNGGGRPQDMAEWLGVPRHAVMSAIEHWQVKGRMTLDDGVVRLRMAAPGDADYVEPDPPLSSCADDSVESQQSEAAE